MPTQTLVLLFVAAVLGLAVVVMLGAAFFTVQQGATVIVQRLGKFLREAGPGLHVKIPIIDTVAGRINLRVQHLDVRIETKTEDNVFLQMVVAVQYYVLPEKVYDAFYKLDDATRQRSRPDRPSARGERQDLAGVEAGGSGSRARERRLIVISGSPSSPQIGRASQHRAPPGAPQGGIPWPT